jgi:acyl-CoA synthetase (AMP-forming)/AMP-acid ligase II
MSNVVQTTTFEGVSRQKEGIDTQVSLGALPFSHIYGLTIISHCGMYRGDEIIVLHRFDLKKVLELVQNYKINQLYIVPPILIQLIRNAELCKSYDLNSVRFAMSGAAPLGKETITQIAQLFPRWKLGQGYGKSQKSRYLCHADLTIRPDRVIARSCGAGRV